MTTAERLLLRGQLQQEERWATTGTFTLDGFNDGGGSPIQWSGVVSDEATAMTLALGGSATDRAIIITANATQFSNESVTPYLGQSVTYNGLRWVIEQMPGLNSDRTAYELRCVGTMNKRAKR